MTRNVPQSLLNQVGLLSCVADEYLDELLQNCYIKEVPPGGVVLWKKQREMVQCYLIQGNIEVWHSFKDRVYLNHFSVECQLPLNDLLFDADVIRAKSRCRVLRVNSNVFGQLVAKSIERESEVFEKKELAEDLWGENGPDDDNESVAAAKKGVENSGKKRPDYFDRAMASIFQNAPVATLAGTNSTGADAATKTPASVWADPMSMEFASAKRRESTRENPSVPYKESSVIPLKAC
jgi:hypothetical protein